MTTLNDLEILMRQRAGDPEPKQVHCTDDLLTQAIVAWNDVPKSDRADIALMELVEILWHTPKQLRRQDKTKARKAS